MSKAPPKIKQKVIQEVALDKCQHCEKSIMIARNTVIYWPDHLWAGKVLASYKCPKCGAKTGKWAHELPVEWQDDWPRPDWETYCLPRLIESCLAKGIEAIPGEYPTSKYWQEWRQANGFTEPPPAPSSPPATPEKPLTRWQRIVRWIRSL